MTAKRIVKIFFVTGLLVALGFFYPLDYYLMMPNRAVALDTIITVEGVGPGERGTFYLTTVSQKQAAPLPAIYGILHPHIDVRPTRAVIPRGMDRDEYRTLLTEYMTESRHVAQIVALRRVGYDVEIISDGVEVVGFTDDAPAEGFLQEGDRITHVDEKPVFLAAELPTLIQDRPVGAEVDLRFIRNGVEKRVQIPTGPKFDEPDVSYLGVYIKTLPWEPVIPIEITMETGGIGGPSAGLMFVLEIMNQLTGEDLAAGRRIAGTGSIDYEENVGRVGGVAQKVVAAERFGAEFFFVPGVSREDAQQVARKVEIVPVDNLEQALEFLSSLSGK